MIYHRYYCKHCDIAIELCLKPLDVDIRGYVDLDKGYYHEFLVSSLSEEEIKALPENKDPRDYEVYEKIYYKDVPSKIKCDCGKMAQQCFGDFAGKVKGGCYSEWKRNREFWHKGMDKSMAETFYKDSIQASKGRMNTGYEHYKEVACNPEALRKQGLARRLSDKEKAEKIERVKKVGAHIRQTRDNAFKK